MKNYEAAIQDYLKVIEINPDFLEAYLNLIFARINIGDYKEAIFTADNLIKIDSQYGDAYIARAIAKKALGDIEGSEKDLKTAKALIEKYKS